ncbi:uncharacterized protein AC631_06017, partial [Debaryomyces fabryi]
MLGWCRWINYLDPVGYAFEALIANEFHGRNFDCAQFVPSGPGYPTSGDSIVCSVVGASTGSNIVNGDDYINQSFEYYFSHRWRNWGIIVAFVLFFLFVHIIICEYNKGAMQKGEILLFQRSALKKNRLKRKDIESGNIEKVDPEFNNEKMSDSDMDKLPSSGDIFHWRKLTYQVKIKSEDRVILND